MSRLRTASLCLTDILNAAKAGHTAFSRSDKNQKVYFKVSIWDNEEKNKFGQDVSIQLSPKKDTSSERLYIGNGEKQEYNPSETINTPEAPVIPENEGDDLPF
jgi:hypothetical protein